MSLPRLLLVDDSESILAFETGLLSSHYAVSTARDGREALAQLAESRPAAVLLDLSMPNMDGEEVLARMQVDPELRSIPVIVVSSEAARAEMCLRAGAAAYMAKPIRKDELRALVATVLEAKAAGQRLGSLACLPMSVGKIALAVPLDSVRAVVARPAAQPLGIGPAYISEFFDFHGTAVCILDVAVRLGVERSSALVEQKLVVLRGGNVLLALAVDDVRDPEEVPATLVTPSDRFGGSEHEGLSGTLVAVARVGRGLLPIVEPLSFVSPELLDELAEYLQEKTLSPPVE